MQSGDDRDRAVEHLLRQAAGATGSPRPDECLAPEIAAAWVDGNLLPHERAAVELHVSGCGRCQAMVAAVVRTTPAAPTAAPWWQSARRWGWLVPLTAGAAAVILWVVTPNDTLRPSSEVRQIGEASSTQALKQEPPPLADRFAQEAPANEGQPAAAAPPVQARERAEESTRADEADADGKRSRDVADQNTVGQSANAAAVEQPQPSAETAAARAAAPSPALLARETVMATVEIVSPDPAVRWRLGGLGLVQRTADSGMSWEVQRTGATVVPTAGASPSPSICWLVGPAGTVLLTTDGQRWQRVAFPDAVDLVAVQAVDAGTATVSVRDGRRLRTTDGGTTWVQVPLQEF